MAGHAPNSISRPPQVPPPVYPSSASLVPSNAPLPNHLMPGVGMSRSSPTNRPSNGPGVLQSPHIPLPSGSPPGSGGYTHSFHPSGASPGTVLSGYPEFPHTHGPFAGGPNMGSHIQMSSMQGQKRAYRQRRKDPSCDACRERKVKCDATDSSSCTECSSRNVKCQFTKETNRRMSNIRHNQDLQKELAQAKSQVNHLRSMLDTGQEDTPNHHLSTSHLPSPEPSHLPNHNLSHLPGPDTLHLHMAAKSPHYELRQPKRRRTAGTVDLTRIGSNMERHGRGIFKPPYPHQQESPLVASPSCLPALPPKDVADFLIRQYHFTLHPTLPMIHWLSFQEQYDNVYRINSLECVPRIWVALLYAVFACGTLDRSWHEGREYLEVSRSLVDMWTDDLTLDHARVALLSCIFLVEMNLKSAGWNWIGFAVRISFDIGLHCEAGTWSTIEEEMRRRVWWCIYTCDCLLSLELGRPALIKEEDCNVGMPSAVDDQYMHASIEWFLPTPEQSTSPLLPTIQVIGGIAKLLRVLKSHFLSSPAIEAYDSHFKGCMQGFPVYQQIRFNDYVDPIELPPIMYLQNARLMLHRHNLTPACGAEDRSAALDRCASTAADTAKLLRRAMQETLDSQSKITEQSDTWEKRMVSAVSAFFCTHIWRCTLFLSFRHDYESAIWCARASATLGASRPVNVACGRYLEFFLEELNSRLDNRTQLDTDEEMVAYVSGDLQGSFENSWIWKGTKEGVHLGRPFQNPTAGGNADIKEAFEKEVAPWDGWNNILTILDHLFQEQQQRQQHRAIQESSLRPPLMLPPLAPSPNPSNRMSIKDLI